MARVSAHECASCGALKKGEDSDTRKGPAGWKHITVDTIGEKVEMGLVCGQGCVENYVARLDPEHPANKPNDISRIGQGQPAAVVT